MWEWTVPEEAVQVERSCLREFSNSNEPELPVMHRLQTAVARKRLLGERSVIVLRDVFRLTPAELRLCRLADEDDWLDEDDEPWPQAQ